VAGLDNSLLDLLHGASLWVVLLLALAVGLRHATDPDHLAAVSTLVATDGRKASQTAARLGLSWGIGHALALTAFGVPVVFIRPYLPDRVQRGAEALVGLVVVLLAIRLLKRWREGAFHAHKHQHANALIHGHLHAHSPKRNRGHDHRHPVRTPLGAFAIGTLHGFGGSAGVVVLALATIRSRPEAVAALLLFAIAAAVSMTLLSTGFGIALVRCPERLALRRAVPLLGLSSLAFGTWYGLAALAVLP
jgi:high-affinity nickel permease